MKKLLILLIIFLISSCCHKDEYVEPYNPLANTTWYYVYHLSSSPEIYEDKFTFTKDNLIVEYLSYDDSSSFYKIDDFWYCYTIREYYIKDDTFDINSGLMKFKFINYGDSMLYGVRKESEIMLYKNRNFKIN